MKIVKCPVTDRGKVLTDPNQGFIVQGNIYVARLDENETPSGGLIGNAFPDHSLLSIDEVKKYVLTKEELLRALCFNSGELRELADKLEKK